MKIRYYGLKDLWKYFELTKNYQYTGIVEEHAIKNIVQAIFPTLTGSLLDTAESDEIWCKYIVPRYFDVYTFGIANGEDRFYEEEWAEWFRLYASILYRTYDKYKALIDIYDDELSNLMNDVKTTSEIKFNDTPQNQFNSLNYNWADDAHLTNISRSSTTNELGTKMARITEIQNNLRNIYADWADEFRGLFIYD